MRDWPRRLRRFGARYSKFSVVGLANWMVDLGVLNLLFFAYPTREPWLFAMYNFVALVSANVSSYFLNTRWTFKGMGEGGRRQRVLFSLQALVNVGLGYALFWLAIRAIFNYTSLSAFFGGNLAKVLSATVTSTLTYFMLRHFVFSSRRWFGGRL